jgi:Tfp pilus assembly protein PilF
MTRLLLRTVLSALFFVVAARSASPQFGLGGKRIQGQVRMEGQPAPQGVLVYLDRSRGRDSSFVNGSGELGNTMTDSRGRFSFENFDAGQENPEGRVYVISVRYPGYLPASQIVDMTGSPTGFANFDLRRDTSKDMPNVPPGGPGGAVSANQPSSPKAQESLARGEDLLMNKHDPRASVKEFKKVVELDPKYAPGFVLLGTAYIQTQEWSDAQSAFEKAVKIEPANPVAYFGVGYALNQQQKFGEAQKALNRSLELRPASAEAQYELGRSFWGLGKWQDAEPHAHKALEIQKDFAPAHVLMGNILLRHRDASGALAEFQEYLRLDPKGPLAASVKEMVDKIEKGLAQR